MADNVALPFEPGKSPFHVKGNSYRGQIEYCNAKVPGGFEAVVQRTQTPEIAAFLRQPFLAGSWYDVFPSLALCAAAASIVHCTAREFSRRVADAQATRDISGLYRFLLKFASPDGIAERLPKLAKQYFDFVDVTVRKLGPGSYESHITGLPVAVVEQYRDVTEAFLDRALRAAGARDLEQLWLPEKPVGKRLGVDVVSLVRTLRWAP